MPALLALLLACTTHEEFVLQENAAICGWYARCDLLGTLGYEDEADCVAELDAWDAADPPACADFSRAAADDCAAGYAELSCETEGGASAPAACGEVCG